MCISYDTHVIYVVKYTQYIYTRAAHVCIYSIEYLYHVLYTGGSCLEEHPKHSPAVGSEKLLWKSHSCALLSSWNFAWRLLF